MTQTVGKLIHLATHFKGGKGWVLLFLRKAVDEGYRWLEDSINGEEVPTNVVAKDPEEAIRLAHRQWKGASFRTIRCGYRFTLPERDEIGMNALFHQMVASYSTMNGVYFDDDLGHQCIVKEISQEAFDLYKQLASENRL
ncbi:MAG: hypothetical protein E6Q59_07775 [Nitrosomonas sp.]|nr:MAG: hypothetical protein E6Q59_07775 [Nitrosomonas sp.]